MSKIKEPNSPFVGNEIVAEMTEHSFLMRLT